MMLEVSKLGLDKDYKKLKHITSSGTTVSLMYLVDDIYKNIIEDMHKSGKGGYGMVLP